MQAMGLVNDHMHDCDARVAATRARSSFKLPLLLPAAAKMAALARVAR
jgi:hypothetical protein